MIFRLRLCSSLYFTSSTEASLQKANESSAWKLHEGIRHFELPTDSWMIVQGWFFSPLTEKSSFSCFLFSFARCFFWYLWFWNQFLICSSVISRPLANSVRSSRVRYCWRENIFSRYWSWRWVKWLRFRRFRLGTFSLRHVSVLGCLLLSFAPSSSMEKTTQNVVSIPLCTLSQSNCFVECYTWKQ